MDVMFRENKSYFCQLTSQDEVNENKDIFLVSFIMFNLGLILNHNWREETRVRERKEMKI